MICFDIEVTTLIYYTFVDVIKEGNGAKIPKMRFGWSPFKSTPGIWIDNDGDGVIPAPFPDLVVRVQDAPDFDEYWRIISMFLERGMPVPQMPLELLSRRIAEAIDPKNRR